MAQTGLSLRLLIDKKNNKVLFAEVDKDFVDFLFYIIALPIGTIIGLLKERVMEGCLQNLYDSIANISQTYLQPDLKKDTLLKPKLPFSGDQVPLLLSNVEFSTTTTKIYRCDNSYNSRECGTYVANDPTAICPSCNRSMHHETTYVEPPESTKDINASSSASAASKGGFVKGVVTYIVMDNLEVKPMSVISSIIMLNKFNITEIGTLEEKVLNFGMEEAVNLLEVSLQSKTVLTDVFISIPSDTCTLTEVGTTESVNDGDEEAK